jgi:hypothetical protein
MDRHENCSVTERPLTTELGLGRVRSAALVSLVRPPPASVFVLLALASGVLADRYELAQCCWPHRSPLAVSTELTVLAFVDELTPGLLLGLTFLLRCGTALMGPAWQAFEPELVVGLSQLRQEAALGAIYLAGSVPPAGELGEGMVDVDVKALRARGHERDRPLHERGDR